MIQDKEYEIQKLNLLAFPRNFTPLCELTGAPATMQLVTPHCTLYYASEELAEQAWYGIIHKVSHLIAPLMLPPPIIGTQEERIRRKKNVSLSKRSLADFCISESAKLLAKKKYQLAVPPASLALKFIKEVDGEHSVAMIDPYLMLANAFLGLNQISQAEEYLSFARWIVLSSTEISDLTSWRLHNLIGRIHFAKGSYDDAKYSFAEAVYFSSKHAGAESIPTSFSYFSLGEVFLMQGGIENGLAFFDKVVDIWYKYLAGLHSAKEAITNLTLANPQKIEESHNTPLLEEYVTEGRTQLEKINDCRRRLLGTTHIATGEAEFTLGLLDYFLLNDESSALRLITSSQKVYEVQLGLEHQSTKHVMAVLQMIVPQV